MRQHSEYSDEAVRPHSTLRMRRRIVRETSSAALPSPHPLPPVRIRRRAFVAGLGAIACRSAFAQPSLHTYRIGFLRIGTPPRSFIEPFRQGLSELGYVEGKNLVIEFEAATTAEQLPEAAAKLVSKNVHLIVASGAAAVLPAWHASGTIPIVFVAGIDPMAAGLASGGLAQHSSNVTGLTTVQIDLTAKRIELLKEMLPALQRIAFLIRDGNPGCADYVREAKKATTALGLKLDVISVRSRTDLDGAFESIRALGADAIVPMDDSVFTEARRQIVELANHYRLPGIYPTREFVEEGGLLSFGPNYSAVFRRAAALVDKIMKGVRPADLPIEQPTTFEIVVNISTSNALQLEIPLSILVRADELME
ncbi:protein of unknown function DUF534 [Methylobacterium sp. 4-46]|nr:protein of unknown function DUF534 [Methylobacterium sp. 4-46]